MSLNLDNISIDANGRVSFSGLSSGIDFEGAVDAIIAAKRIPVDTLETKVTLNADRITALEALRTSLFAMRDALSTLYGAVSFQNTGDIFENKQAFASTTRVDGVTPPSAGNLIGISVTNESQLGSHTIDVIQTAAGHKVSSSAYTSTSTSLGLTSGDTFTIEGVTITLSGSETLGDLRNRINTANTGTSATGVTASIVSVSSTEHYLILTRAEGDAEIALIDTTGTPLQTLGILDGSAAIANELQAPQMAQYYADGLLDQTDMEYESSYQATDTLLGSDGQITFSEVSPVLDFTVDYASTDTLATLAASINTASGTAGAGVTATVVTDGAGERLEISGTGEFTMAESDPGSGVGTALTDLGIDNSRLLSTRSTNTITDAFSGVTLSLFQASAGTTIKFEIERDLTAVKAQITTFVDSYNSVRNIINGHRLLNSTTGDVDDEAGELYNSNALKEIDQTLSLILGQGVSGVSEEYSVLSQIGINFVDNNSLDDELNKDTLTIDDTVLDAALLSNTDDIKRLFTFDFTSSDPRVSLLGFDANTTYNETGYTINIQPASVAPGGEATSNIDGNADGTDDSSTTTATNTITVLTGNAMGLHLFFDSFTATTAVTVDFTVGVGAQLFLSLDQLLDTTSGVIETELDTLTDQNVLNTDRINEMLLRLENKRTNLLDRFISMEIALASANSIRDTISTITDAWFQDN